MLIQQDIKLLASQHRIAIIITSGFLAALFIVLISPAFQECVKANQKNNSDQSLAESSWVFIRTLWWCGGIFAKENGEALTGLASVSIAIFTWTLWRATSQQGKLTQDSINLARDEFNATHRPEIIIHTATNATAVKIGGGTVLGITIIYFNKGTSPAKNTKLFASVIGIDYGTTLDDNLHIARFGELPGPVISGKPYSFTTWSEVVPEDAEFGPTDSTGRQPNPKFTVYCIGTISYEDSSDVQRQIGFCWEWSRKKWVRVTGNSYDYSY